MTAPRSGAEAADSRTNRQSRWPADDDPSSRTRRGLLRAVGTATALAVTGATGPGAVGTAGAQTDVPAPSDLEVVTRLPTKVEVSWSDVPGGPPYDLRVNGEESLSTGRTRGFVSCPPDATSEIAVRVSPDDGEETPWATTTVTTPPQYDQYPVSLDLSIDPERTDDEGRLGVVVSLTDLPDDAAVEAYSIRYEHTHQVLDGVFRGVEPELREDAPDDASYPFELRHEQFVGTHEWGWARGTARDAPPTAADEPVPLVTLFHGDVTEPDAEIPFEVELLALTGVEGSVAEPWDVETSGIVDWELSTGDGSVADVLHDPGATFRSDAVVVEGATEFDGVGCKTVYPRRIASDASSDRLEVEIDGTRRHEVDPELDADEASCGDGTEIVGYELTVDVDATPSTAVVDELFDGGVEDVALQRASCGTARTVDGRTVCDVDGDGAYRDVTGDGSVDTVDVVEFFQVQHREAWKRPELFDFSGNGDVGHGDVVALFEYVSAESL